MSFYGPRTEAETMALDFLEILDTSNRYHQAMEPLARMASDLQTCPDCGAHPPLHWAGDPNLEGWIGCLIWSDVAENFICEPCIESETL